MKCVAIVNCVYDDNYETFCGLHQRNIELCIHHFIYETIQSAINNNLQFLILYI